MPEVVMISADEIACTIVAYQAAVDDLYDRLKGTGWDDKFRVTMAFEIWTNRDDSESYCRPWLDAYKEARDYIEVHGFPPWDTGR